MKLQEVTGYHTKTALILKEGIQDLTESQIIYLNKWEKELWPLLEEYARLAEAELTSDQIKNIFQSAEKTAASDGKSKTALGKVGSATAAAAKLPVDIAKSVNQKINELGQLAKNAGPVKNMDQKFNELKAQITADNDDSKIVQGIEKISNWAKENPGKASLAVGILTTIAAFSSGPAGGAVAGLVLRSTKELLQGADVSTAVGKSLKTAALGALAGATFNYISDAVTDNIVNATEADIMNQWDSLENAVRSDALAEVGQEYGGLVDQLDNSVSLEMSGNVNRFSYNYDVILEGDNLDKFQEFQQSLRGMKTFSEEWYKTTADFHEFMGGVQADPMQQSLQAAKAALEAAQEVNISPEDLQQAGIFDRLDNLEDFISTAEQVNPAIAAAAQGAVTAAEKQEDEAQKASAPKEADESNTTSDADKKESIRITDKDQLVESLWDDFDMYEVSFADTMKKAKAGAAKIGQKGIAAAKAGAKAAGKELGQKVTVRKLNSQWKKMGSPTDSGSIANLLADAGMNDEQIGTVAQQNNVELPVSTTASSDQSDQQTTQQATDATQTDSAGQTSTTTDIESVAAEIKKLPPKTIEKIKAELQKQIQKSTSTS